MRDETLKNNLVVKFMGKAEIPSELEIGRNYLVNAEGTITSKTEADNNDGTHTIYYKFQPIRVIMVNDKGESIKLKDPRRNSEKLRKYLWKVWSDSEWCTEDFDDVYTAFTNEVMSIMPVILQDSVKRLK